MPTTAATPSTSIRSTAGQTEALARRHPQRAVEPDHLAVEHRVLDDVTDESGEFRRPAEPPFVALAMLAADSAYPFLLPLCYHIKDNQPEPAIGPSRNPRL